MKKITLKKLNNECEICGCRDGKPCKGGCYWEQPNLCSKCLPNTDYKKELKKGDRILRNGTWYNFVAYGDRKYEGKREIIAFNDRGSWVHFLDGHFHKALPCNELKNYL